MGIITLNSDEVVDPRQNLLIRLDILAASEKNFCNKLRGEITLR